MSPIPPDRTDCESDSPKPMDVSALCDLRCLAVSDVAAGSPTAAATAAATTETQEQLQMRLCELLNGAMTTNMIYLGDRLGLYVGLASHGPCTAAGLASALGLNERYVAEWLRQQAAAHIITTDDAADKFWLTLVQQDVLVHEHGPNASPFYFAGMFSAAPAITKAASERLPELFREGGGISYNDIDVSVHTGVCRELGVWARHALVPYLCALPGLQDALEKGCMVADVGCGCGEALMTVAARFPASTFHGYDIAEDALWAAKEEAARRGLPNCTFLNSGLDEETMPGVGAYRLVMTHDAIHDMAHPAQVMAAVRRAVAAPDGCWIIGDMGALESHAANIQQHPMAALLYGFSLHLCLPSGMSAPGGAALGTMGMSADLMCRMLREAGFGSAEVLESWKHPLNRYYIARP